MHLLKMFSAYYKPYIKVLFAALASMTVLVYPLLVNEITNHAISDEGIAADLVIKMAGIFVLLMVVEYASNFYTDYYGHVMGGKDQIRHAQRFVSALSTIYLSLRTMLRKIR